MTEDKYLVAVDGGGTKTEFCAYNVSDCSKTYFYAKSTNYKSVGKETAVINLRSGFNNLFHELKLKIENIGGMVLGFSGYDSEQDFQVYDEALSFLNFDKAKIYLCNDSELAFHAAGSAPGVVIICGTGSIALGIDAEGNKCRAGGWGSCISDQGSGYWIGSQIIRELLLYCDGCREYQPVFDQIRRQYHAENFEKVPLLLTRLDGFGIAATAKTVLEFAEQGDLYSTKHCNEAVDHLMVLIRSVYKRMDFSATGKVEIILAGSLFKNEFFRSLMEKRVEENFFGEKVKLIYTGVRPVDGGINIAIQMFMNNIIF